MKITRKQLLELENGLTTEKLNKWFPEVFGVTLEVGKWYKKPSLGDGQLMIFVKEIIDAGNAIAYGLNARGIWCDDKDFGTAGIKKATKEEVFEALKNEAIKRYNKGDCVKCLYNEGLTVLNFGNVKINNDVCHLGITNCLWMNGEYETNTMVFDNGKWAKIIPTKTRKQAEELLGVKIID